MSHPRTRLAAALAVVAVVTACSAGIPDLLGRRIPGVALDAYQHAAAAAPEISAGCAVDWQVVAGLARVESNHGRTDGPRTIAANGDVRPAIRGLALDGSSGRQRIPDTDAGVRDGDAEWDRAMGPLQFLPTTWEEILARPRPVTVEVLLTGTVDGDRLVVLDESDPNIEELGDHHAPSTVLAYWVHHPTEGDYLIDAGLARAFAHEGGNYTGLLRLILALIGAESRSTDGADVASQLVRIQKLNGSVGICRHRLAIDLAEQLSSGLFVIRRATDGR